MGGYIDRELLIHSVAVRKAQELITGRRAEEEINGYNPTSYMVGFDRGMQTALDIILGCPAADVTEVKHGDWLSNAQTDEYICSECDGIAPVDSEKEDFYESNYCPNCGAKMDEKKGDEL